MKVDNVFKQFIKFCLVGFLNTAVDWGIFFLLAHFVFFFQTQTHEVYAKAIAFILAVGNSFILNSLWTFREEFKMGLAQFGNKKIPAYFSKFFIVSLVGLIVNTSAFSITRTATSSLFNQKEIAQLSALVVATLVVLVWNFLANKFWTFRVRK